MLSINAANGWGSFSYPSYGKCPPTPRHHHPPLWWLPAHLSIPFVYNVCNKELKNMKYPKTRAGEKQKCFIAKCKVAKSGVCGADTLSVLEVDDSELGWNEIKCYIAPLRVKRNCLSSGKYGFTLTSSPVALGSWNQKSGQILELNVVTIIIHWTLMPNILSQLTSM